jgi:hypothetical protein
LIRGTIKEQQKARPVFAGAGLFIAIDCLTVMRVANMDASRCTECRSETNLQFLLGKTATLPHIVSVFNN